MDKIKQILMKYRGTMKEDPGEIVFTNTNTIIDWKGNKHKVPCEIRIRKAFIVDPERYAVDMEEKTLAILGGECCGHLTKEEAIQRVRHGLKRYCYEKKQNEQYSLF